MSPAFGRFDENKSDRCQAEVVELLLGAEWRNRFLRVIMSLSFYLPIPKPADLEVRKFPLEGSFVILGIPRAFSSRRKGRVFLACLSARTLPYLACESPRVRTH